MILQKTTLYKMIFCDIDGTLIDSNHRISCDTKQKIQELHSIGVPFILVSARMPSGVLHVQDDLGIKAPIICYSGALILDERGECIKTIGIKRDKAILLDTFIKAEWKDICCSAFYHNDWITDDIHDEWVLQEQHITSSIATKGKIPDFVPPNGHLNKFLCMGNAQRIAALNEIISKKYPELAVYRSKDTYLEIMDGTASKSSAIKCLCDKYGIPIESTVSFGDNFNDVDMLLATGTSFAMGNAPESVKRQAQNVTLDNDREGVLAGLNQLHFTGN